MTLKRLPNISEIMYGDLLRASFLLVALFIQTTYGWNQDCNCIPLQKCKSLRDLMESLHKPLTPHALQYLKEQQCDFKDGHPMVCCSNIIHKIALPMREKNISTHKCDSSRGEICMEIRKCPFFDDLLNRSVIPRPKNVIKLIREKQCSFYKNIPYVCCREFTTEVSTDLHSTSSSHITPRSVIPSDITEASRQIEGPSRENMLSIIKSHPNYRLLPNEICGPIATDSRITSGTKATLNEYPWMALIAYDIDGGVDFRCGGTVINERYVLTAAHCIINSTIIGVRLGEHNLDTIQDCDKERGYCASPTQDFYAEKLIVHQDYNPRTFENDIALIKLATAANFSCDNVQPICLPIDDIDISGKFVTVSGWGVTEEGFKSPELLKVSLPVLPISNCQRVYNRFAPINTNQICAGGYQGRDSCGGDSGGPLMTVNKYEGIPRYIQYGVVSYGPRHCGTEGKPGIYTRVSKYMTWILDSLQPWTD